MSHLVSRLSHEIWPTGMISWRSESAARMRRSATWISWTPSGSRPLSAAASFAVQCLRHAAKTTPMASSTDAFFGSSIRSAFVADGGSLVTTATTCALVNARLLLMGGFALAQELYLS